MFKRTVELEQYNREKLGGLTMIKRFKLQILFVLLAIIMSIYFIEAPGANTINTSTPEDTVLGFASALVDGDIDKASMYLEFSEDNDSMYQKNISYLKNKDMDGLIKLGNIIKGGVMNKRMDSYAEWDVQINFNGDTVKAPVIIIITDEGWRIRNF